MCLWHAIYIWHISNIYMCYRSTIMRMLESVIETGKQIKRKKKLGGK